MEQQNPHMEPDEKKNDRTPAAADTDAFWDLPPIHKKTYAPPTYDGRTTDTIPVSEEGAQPGAARTESIPPRDPAKTYEPARPTRPADRTFKTASYATSRGYRDRMQRENGLVNESAKSQGGNGFFSDFDSIDAPAKHSAGEIVSDRAGEGWLIRQVTVRTWINDFSFYAGFGRNAASSHNRRGIPVKPVPYGSFVPQYAQMDDRQLAFYLWFRDNARAGTYLDADFAYILLYIFEILNIPELVPPAEGMQILCGLWAHYREKYRKLDTYLCEWVPDYALIHGVPLPGSIEPFLGDIVRRAQCKEFYLDNMTPPGGRLSKRALEVLAGVLLEAYSDYDYTKSRYYTGGNRQVYDDTIREVLTTVLLDAYEKNRGMFVLDRIYRLTRDSYCGAIIQTDQKRRIDVAFHSCIRSPDTRRFVTGVVKYAENRLRGRLRIKSKLGVTEISAEDKAVVDAWFGPDDVVPAKKKAAAAEEEAYLKQYEAETQGFDFTAAHRIEADSWVNTSRLTVEEAALDAEDDRRNVQSEMPAPESILYEPEMEEEVPGAVVMAENVEEIPCDFTPAEESERDFAMPQVPAHDRHSLEKEAVAALLDGRFVQHCRDQGLFPGRVAEQINEIFLDVVGDILIDADGFTMIEDYREDAIAWCSNQT